MSVQSVTCSRTIGLARNLCSTALVIGAFLAVSAALFAFSLDPAEGSRMSLTSLWTLSIVPVLPFLCVLLGMDSWSEDRRVGRMDMLLSLPVRERDLVLGKFLGVCIIAFSAVVASLVIDLTSLFFLAPEALEGVSLGAFLPALLVLAMQCALYSSATIAVSAFFLNTVASATVSIAVVWAIPHGVWYALVSWFPSGSGTFGEFPLEAHAVDIAAGAISLSVVVFYALSVITALFIAVKAVFATRFIGRRAIGRRVSTMVTIALSVVVASLSVVLAARLDLRFEFPMGDGKVRFSQRTRDILAESRGDITITSLVSRGDRRFRSVSHLLRSLARESASVGGSKINIAYVDPRWDVGEAGRFVRDGVSPPALVFSNHRRRVTVSLADGWGERTCASAILRLTVPPSRNAVYWTCGHGESSFSDYGSSGMSDIARELSRDGYRNFNIDLASEAKIPSDCALIAIAGSKRNFSRAETARIDAFLRQGGRLLILAEGAESALLSTLIPSWGAIVKGVAGKPVRTLTGTDSVISEFGDHPISAPLKGSQIVLERPVLFAPSAAAGGTSDADSIEFCSLAETESLSAAVVLERGSAAGSDIAIRPTRIVVIGDVAFVRNSQLESRANANRDFFLNCISYLSGSHALTSGGSDGELFVTGLDRRGRLRLLTVAAIAIPSAVALALLLIVWRRRTRK